MIKIRIVELDITTYAVDNQDADVAIHEALEGLRIAAIKFNCQETLNKMKKTLTVIKRKR